MFNLAFSCVVFVIVDDSKTNVRFYRTSRLCYTIYVQVRQQVHHRIITIVKAVVVVEMTVW